MNLTLLIRLLHHLEKEPNSKVVIVHLVWQQPFYEDAFKEYIPDRVNSMGLITVKQELFEDFEDTVWCHWA